MCALPISPKITGDDLPHVRTGSEMRELLAGKVTAESAAKLPAWQRAAAKLLGGPVQPWMQPNVLRRATRFFMPLGKAGCGP